MPIDRFAQIESALGNHWTVRRIAGSFRPGVKNGRALESLFHSPSCACVTSNGDILVCTTTDRHIRVIRSSGIVESLPSCWLKPSGLCSTEHGIVVCDAGHHRIKFLSVDGKRVTSIAGVGRKGFRDGPVTIAEFNNPCSCCYDSAGALYVVDKGNHSIRRIKDGLVLTVAGKGIPGHADGDLALFSSPSDIAYHGPTGQFFVADTGNHCVRSIRADLTSVRTIAGTPGNPGHHNGPCLGSLFHFPSSLAVVEDAESKTNIVIAVADTFNNQIRRIFFDKDFVDTLVGSLTAGTADGNRSVSKFYHPSWLRFKRSLGNDSQSLIVCDTENNVIREIFMSAESEIIDSWKSTPKKTNECISRFSTDSRSSPHRSPSLQREQFISPAGENQKFDFSPRRGTPSRPKVQAVHSFGLQATVASMYSGVTHLFQYQHGAYRYVSPCRILLVPADCDFAKPRMEFLEIPSDKVLSSCSLDSDVKISVQNFTFVYFTKFGIGCRFGNRSESDKFLEVLNSLNLSFSDFEKPAQRIISSASMPQSPSNYAKQRQDRPFPLEVGLGSPTSDQATHNHLPGLCDRVARDIDSVCADIMSVASTETFRSGDRVQDVHLTFWRNRLLDCSGRLMSSLFHANHSSSSQQASLSTCSASSQSLANILSDKLPTDKVLDGFDSRATCLQVSWCLLRVDREVSSTMFEQCLYFNVSSGEIIKLKLCFRGCNFQVSDTYID